MRNPQKESMKNYDQENEKKEKVAEGLVAARETLRRVLLYSPYCLPYLFSEGRLIMQLEYSSNGKIGGTCFYVGAETLSLESPFPNTPKSGSMMHAASCSQRSRWRRGFRKI